MRLPAERHPRAGVIAHRQVTAPSWRHVRTVSGGPALSASSVVPHASDDADDEEDDDPRDHEGTTQRRTSKRQPKKPKPYFDGDEAQESDAAQDGATPRAGDRILGDLCSCVLHETKLHPQHGSPRSTDRENQQHGGQRLGCGHPLRLPSRRYGETPDPCG